MRKSLLWVVLPLLLLGAGWLSLHLLQRPPAGLTLASGASLEWTDCWFETPLLRPVYCGYLHTRTEPGAKPPSFRLPVVYAPAWFWKRSRPPIVHIAGGPGGATGLDAKVMPVWLDWLDQVDWPADVILYDQRGVGLSQPKPDCPELRTVRRQLLGSDQSAEQQYLAVQAANHRCRDRLLAEGWDLTRFNTPKNADDVMDLVATLGLHDWQLYGVSYGTRVALEVQRRDPPGLRALVLDSVYPPQVQGEAANAWLLNRSLRLLTRSCELLGDCEYHKERLSADLRDSLQRLAKEPLRIDLRDPDSGQSVDVTLDNEDLAWLVFESQYVWSNLPLLPGAVDALARGHVSPDLHNLLQESLDALLDPSLNEAVGTSVDCADNGPLEEARFEALRHQFPLIADIIALDWRYGPCRDWPSGDAGEAFRAPVQGTQPMLLLSGEFDPVTPPEWAQLAASTQKHAYTLTFPGIGHGVLDSDACALEVVRAFWLNPEAPLNVPCLSRM